MINIIFFIYYHNIFYLVHNNTGGSMKKIKLLLIGLFLLSPLNVLAYSEYIYAGGDNVGIEINSNGVLVIGFYKVDGKDTKNDIKIGDYITKVNNEEVKDIDSLVKLIDKYENDGVVNLTIKRKNTKKDISFKLINKNGIYKTGLYVKDSISGIGTLTYIDPNTKIYGALGHEIIESNTNKRLELKDGKIFRSDVSSIDRSTDGKPGTKNAKFFYNTTYGDITKNTIHGIYGTYDKAMSGELLKVGSKNDLKIGEAYIRTSLDDNIVDDYKIMITKIDTSGETKNIYFEIVDEELLDRCGGIVQGMSGSPIIQDNKIYGAVTHVIVENVKKGYGVFIETMLNTGEN